MKMMKSAAAAMIVLTLVFAMLSCGGGSSPSAVARKAITSIEKADQKGINDTFTPEAAVLVIAMLEKAQGQMLEKGGVDKTE